MSIQDWAAIGEIVSAVAILVTLIYLAIQIRQSARATQAASRDAMSKSTIDILMRIACDPKMVSFFRLGMTTADELDEDQTLQFDLLMYAIFDSWETTFAQWKRGAMTDEDWTKWEAIIGNYMAHAGAQAFWGRVHKQFNPRFQTYIDGLAHHHNYDWAAPKSASVEG
jgi:hypothetical protein